MSAHLLDLTGQVFGRLTVQSRADNASDGKVRWICLCSCGGAKIVRATKLRAAETRSCGCIAKERPARLSHGHARNGARHPLYATWRGIKVRCTNPQAKDWPRYGGRGITMCERWGFSFPDFLADVGPKPGPEHSIDRIDNDGNYEPGNVRWADPTVQATNKRSVHLTIAAAREIREKQKEGASCSSLAAEYGVGRGQIYKVINHINWKESA